MNKKNMEIYGIGVVFAATIMGLGVGVMLASVPLSIFNPFDGLVITCIGGVVGFALLRKLERAGCELKVVAKEGDYK